MATVIREHLDELNAALKESPGASGLPAFVQRELRAVANCGDFLRGFALLRCNRCRRHRVLPFSCKRRLCPSCAGRTMAERAAHLVDRVLRRELTWRQWVFTYPPELAVGLCFHADLAAAVLRISMRVLFEWLRQRSDEQAARRHPAAVVQVQRHSDRAGSWFHIHVLCADGVFYEPKDTQQVHFEHQPPPTDGDVHELVRTVAVRVQRYLSRRGLQAADAEQMLLHRCASAAASRRTTAAGPASPTAARVRLCANHEGFGLHAATSVKPGRAAELERVCRYLSRPPIPESRLSRRDDGRIVLKLKRPRRGVTELVFEPVNFVARLAALVAPPRWPMVRFWGALSPASPIRAAAIPPPPDPKKTKRPIAPKRPQRMRRDELLERVFLVDATLCPCGGRLALVRLVRDPDVIEAILAAITLTNQAPARGPPPAPTP